MPTLSQQTHKHATDKKTFASEPTAPVELLPLDSTIESPYSTEKWRREFDELANRLLQKLDRLHNSIDETTQQLLAKAHAMQEMKEIHNLVGQRFDLDWEKYRGLSHEELREIHSQLYLEELTARMQQDVLNQPTANWEEHCRRRIELIQWSKLSNPEKEKWLEFYNNPSPDLNLNEGENHADQTQECPDGHSTQTNEQQKIKGSESESSLEATRRKN